MNPFYWYEISRSGLDARNRQYFEVNCFRNSGVQQELRDVLSVVKQIHRSIIRSHIVDCLRNTITLTPGECTWISERFTI